MRVYRSGHAARVSLMLAMTVLAVVAIAYGLGALEGWGRALAVGLAAGLLLSSSWVLVWVLRQNEERLRARALNDSLTDLPNRTSFVERLDHALARTSGGSRPIAVLLVDLDDFEEINHTLGHEAGDRLLAAVGERLAGSVRPEGYAARLCGDEFAVLFSDIPDRSSATSAAERVGEALRAPIEVEGSEVLLSASIGVAIPEEEDGPEDLLRKADVAMHAAKRKGKARHKVFDRGADTTTSGRSLAEADMRRAVEEEQFRVHYQPLVALGTGKVRGLEALVRWQHPVYGSMSPEEFVPLAEQMGLIVPIGRWVLREACRRMSLWQEEHPSDPPLMLNVNVSARQFRQPNLAAEILRTLEGSGLGPHQLILEITEGVMVHDASAASTLRELQGSGIRFAMDDFGTGYSNLSYVKRLPVHILKIDRSYVSGLGSDAEATAIVHATAAFAKALGLGLIAEGIENAEQVARLREVGCELGQGHHFARPLPSEEVSAFLREHLHRSTIVGSG